MIVLFIDTSSIAAKESTATINVGAFWQVHFENVIAKNVQHSNRVLDLAYLGGVTMNKKS